MSALEVGAMFWAERDSLDDIAAMKVKVGQLCIGGDTQITAGFSTHLKVELAQRGIEVLTVFAAYQGEDYADIPTVQRTVGFIPHRTREARLARTLEISDFAAKLGVDSIACHIGFVPEDKHDADYLGVREMVRRVCDHAHSHGQTFALETGQEPAKVLLEFIHDVERPNLKVNFDPANMILYGSGDPHEAIQILAHRIISVHAKDGNWPDASQPGSLGKEQPLGKGSVNIPKFVESLKNAGYQGALCVERETNNQAERIADMQMGVNLLRSLV